MTTCRVPIRSTEMGYWTPTTMPTAWSTKGQADRAEYISFRLDTSIADNWKLVERRPDYRTTDTADQTQWHVICEHVIDFACRRFSAGMVEINLTLKNDSAQVNLKTRAKARNLK